MTLFWRVWFLLLLFVFRVCIWLCLGCFLRNVFLCFFVGYGLGCYPFELSRHMAGIIIGSSVPPHCQLSNQVESLLIR